MSDRDTGPATDAGVGAPVLRVVKGDPAPEEVAALIAVVSSMAAAAEVASRRERPTPAWSAHHRKLRPPHRPGPGSWRTGARAR